MSDKQQNGRKVVVHCPVCGFTDEVEDFNKDEELCVHCGKSTYTFRTADSIRKIFVGELNKKKSNE